MKTSTGNRFDELFNERFRDFSETPPASVLEKIKNTTSGMSSTTPFWKKGGFFATMGIIAFVGTTVLLINAFSSTETTKTLNKELIADNNITKQDANPNQVITNDAAVNQPKNTINTSDLKSENVSENTEKVVENKEIYYDNEKQATPPNNTTTSKNISQQTGNTSFSITTHINAATCRKANGKVTLSSNNPTVLFYWLDVDTENPHSVMEKLLAGTYNIKSVSNLGIIQNIVVTVPDSGITHAGFTHYEMTQAIGVPVYFSNKITIDGADAENIENTTFKWYFGDGKTSSDVNPEHLYSSTGPFKVSLVAISPQGCKDSCSAIPLYIAGSDIVTSNIFTPNGDGNNDLFIPAVQALQSYSLMIFNRNGQTLFSTTNPSVGWDGKINHGSVLASPGTYYYAVKGVGIDGKIIEYKGSVDLRL